MNLPWPRLVVVAAVLVGAVDVVGTPPPGRPPSAAAGRRPQAVSGGGIGTLEGLVRLNAPAVPRPTEVENTTDPAVCGRSHTLEDLIVSGTTRGVANVIVALGDVPAGSVPPQAAGTLVLDNRDCRFVPHAAVLTAGGTIEIVNSDPTLHTVHFYGPVDLNIALPLRGMRIARRLDRTGLVAVRCDVHGWMQAYIRVDTHPFHAVTDASGAFRIAGVPPGEYAVGVWHERLGARSERVRIRPGAVTRTEFHYTLGSGGG